MNFSSVGQTHFLKTIVERKRVEVGLAEKQSSLALLRKQAGDAEAPRDFLKAFSSGFACIAEIKKRSPSRGLLTRDFHPERIARAYERGGAAALSVLTDNQFFDGSLDEMMKVRRSTSLPILRKDFIVDEYQIYEARACGADAILLISEILTENEVRAFIDLARQLGMAALVESHKAEGIEKAKHAGAEIIGVNNRNLDDFSLDSKTSFSLKPLIPEDIVAISESGIKTSGDLQRLRDVGYRGALIGETLMINRDPEQALRNLLEPMK